jgi:protein phosphatase
MQHVLKRAVGLDQHLVPDYIDGEVNEGDVFLICCDGVWEPLGDKRIHEILYLHTDPQRAADELVNAALAAGGGDNATTLVVRVDALPKEDWRDLLQAGKHLPLPARLKPGQRIDGFEVLQLLHESRATLLYKVRSGESGQIYALKTLQPTFADDKQSCEGLLAEEWLAKRLVSPHFPHIIPLAGEARHFLYYVMSFHDGVTLQNQLNEGTHFSVATVTDISTRMLKGLGALHRLSITHRDIKPANLHIGKDSGLRILDMGVALAAGVPYPELQGNAGTPSYMAPELFSGEAASAQSDLYAAGVTLYHLLTRKYPYGEVEPFQNPQFGEASPPTRFRPDVPMWLENIILKAVAREPKQRFETAEEMLLALERGDAMPLETPTRTPLIERHPKAIWTSLLAVSVALNLLLVYLLLIR